MNTAIIVMAKVPTAGNVKTRLQPFLTPEQCAELAECFLLDTVNKLNSLSTRIIMAYSPNKERDSLQKLLPRQRTLIKQKGNDLGEKMFHAFQFAFKKNFDAVVMIGTDSPTFPLDFIEKAFEYLQTADAVLGATEDGGFYLIGLRKLRSEIFEKVEWSSPDTFRQTVRNIKKFDLKLTLLPSWFDVDLPADLERLRKDLMTNPSIAPTTFDWIRKNLP